MTFPELETLAKRVTFRDWKPHFQSYATGFSLWWSCGNSRKTRDHYVISSLKEDDVIYLMRFSVIEGIKAQAYLDFKVEPKGD